MIATFKLINSYFWKTFYGPIISFIFPILLLAILGNIMRIEYVYPGIMAMSILFVGILALPLAIMELKGSSLFKYIGSSPVSPMKFSFVVIFYYTFISIITIFIVMFATMGIFPQKTFHSKGFRHGILGGFITLKGFSSFYLASLLHLMLVIFFGLAIATFSKTPQQALTISIIIIIPSIFLSGMTISVDIISESKAMQWVSRFSPFRYTTANIVVATTPLDQLGDLFKNITPQNKKLMINENFIDDNGYIVGTLLIDSKDPSNLEIKSFNSETSPLNLDSKFQNNFKITSSKELINFVDKNRVIINDFEKTFFSDKFLYDLIFSKSSALYPSGNNIFDWVTPWVVRRVPSTNELRTFINNFLISHTKNPSSFEPLIKQIISSKLEFLELFFKQSNILYTQVDKILNILLPLIMIGGSAAYIVKKFSWTNK